MREHLHQMQLEQAALVQPMTPPRMRCAREDDAPMLDSNSNSDVTPSRSPLWLARIINPALDTDSTYSPELSFCSKQLTRCPPSDLPTSNPNLVLATRVAAAPTPLLPARPAAATATPSSVAASQAVAVVQDEGPTPTAAPRITRRPLPLPHRPRSRRACPSAPPPIGPARKGGVGAERRQDYGRPCGFAGGGNGFVVAGVDAYPIINMGARRIAEADAQMSRDGRDLRAYPHLIVTATDKHDNRFVYSPHAAAAADARQAAPQTYYAHPIADHTDGFTSMRSQRCDRGFTYSPHAARPIPAATTVQHDNGFACNLHAFPMASNAHPIIATDAYDAHPIAKHATGFADIRMQRPRAGAAAATAWGEAGVDAGYALVLVVDAGGVVALDIEAHAASAVAWGEDGDGADHPRSLIADAGGVVAWVEDESLGVDDECAEYASDEGAEPDYAAGERAPFSLRWSESTRHAFPGDGPTFSVCGRALKRARGEGPAGAGSDGNEGAGLGVEEDGGFEDGEGGRRASRRVPGCAPSHEWLKSGVLKKARIRFSFSSLAPSSLFFLRTIPHTDTYSFAREASHLSGAKAESRSCSHAMDRNRALKEKRLLSGFSKQNAESEITEHQIKNQNSSEMAPLHVDFGMGVTHSRTTDHGATCFETPRLATPASGLHSAAKNEMEFESPDPEYNGLEEDKFFAQASGHVKSVIDLIDCALRHISKEIFGVPVQAQDEYIALSDMVDAEAKQSHGL
ncbi:hypothetical protein DFH09DRAFT_1502741 [Mycena vulgaris]|nr:hypothetical protein DFH09DRAFT_1502741 [Mycena vulgaris]